jgi:hypothetical protein
MRRHCRSTSSCGQDSAALDCRIFLSFRIRRLVWRLVFPRRQGGMARKRVAKKLKVTETTSQKVSRLE